MIDNCFQEEYRILVLQRPSNPQVRLNFYHLLAEIVKFSMIIFAALIAFVQGLFKLWLLVVLKHSFRH